MRIDTDYYKIIKGSNYVASGFTFNLFTLKEDMYIEIDTLAWFRKDTAEFVWLDNWSGICATDAENVELVRRLI